MRIISLLPAASEICAYLGVTDQLVGITHECDFPAVIGSRPRVTSSTVPAAGAHGTASAGEVDAAVREANASGHSLFTLDAERIRSLHPDMILTQALCDVCAVSETDVRALAATLDPAPRIVTLGGTTIDGIFADIRAVADALGVSDEADELIAGERARLRRVHETLKSAQAPRPSVLVVEWTDPVYLAGHWGPEQVHKAGGRDVLGEAGAHSTTVSLEACINADPQIVLIAPCGYDRDAARGEANRLMADPAWTWLLGRQVWAIDANGLVSRPGPRVVDGVETMARIFNPTLFSTLDPMHAVRVA